MMSDDVEVGPKRVWNDDEMRDLDLRCHMALMARVYGSHTQNHSIAAERVQRHRAYVWGTA